jgi:hypothetical protein
MCSEPPTVPRPADMSWFANPVHTLWMKSDGKTALSWALYLSNVARRSSELLTEDDWGGKSLLRIWDSWGESQQIRYFSLFMSKHIYLCTNESGLNACGCSLTLVQQTFKYIYSFSVLRHYSHADYFVKLTIAWYIYFTSVKLIWPFPDITEPGFPFGYWTLISKL